jgi:hypothetical protein
VVLDVQALASVHARGGGDACWLLSVRAVYRVPQGIHPAFGRHGDVDPGERGVHEERLLAADEPYGWRERHFAIPRAVVDRAS